MHPYNEGHFEGMTANKYNNEEESRYQRPRFGLRKYLTNKNEGHFTSGWTPSRGAPKVAALFGITGNGVWS